MASRLCKVLQDSVLSVCNSGVEVSKLPDWADVMTALEHVPDVGSGKLTWLKPNMVPTKFHARQTRPEFVRCQCLLALVHNCLENTEFKIIIIVHYLRSQP